MRLDKYISDCGIMSRKECAAAAKAGQIRVNGEVCKNASVHIDENSSIVTLAGKVVNWRRYYYVMLNKPSGYICSTEDSIRTVMKLLPPEFEKIGLFPCGRLDIDTVGLLLVTNNGPLAHELLSPRHHVEKTYRYTCSPPLTIKMAAAIESGVDIGGYVTKPAHLVCYENGKSGEITITEGKFHQIKRMFTSVGCTITSLERIKFGTLSLDENLERGQWRYLTMEEQTELENVGKS